MLSRRPVRLRMRGSRLRRPAINRIVPNVLTVLALCAGLTAIRFGLEERWEFGVFAVLIAGILDGLDGRLARLLGGTSKFGAELDSLSDFVSFGVAPAVLLYLWTMHSAGGLGWALVLLFAVCCALRLARFNTRLGDPAPPPWAAGFFTGVPAPAGAALVLLPMMISFQFGGELASGTLFTGGVVCCVAVLMISQIPTYSMKQVRISHRYMVPVLLVAGAFAAAVVSAPWLTLLIINTAYLASIPFSVRAHGRFKRMAEPALPPAQQQAELPSS